MAATSREAPAQRFLGDYREFFRAYKSAFAFWLREEADGSAKKSQRSFAELLQRAARIAETTAAFEELLAEVYERPLNAPELDDDMLEAEFLKWIGRQ